jgi:predicted O-methyltransferase YrrM
MSDFILKAANAYAEQTTTNVDELLLSIEEFTLQHHPKAHMISGKIQGRLLEAISRMISPKKVLEIGTFTGYSAICLAKGLAADGQLHTIEIREDDALTASGFIEKAGLAQQVKVHVGNAMDIIPSLGENWDLIFIDADKVNYIAYYELTLPLLKKGGWILSDNVLFHGQVLENPVKGKNAEAIDAFNKHVAQDSRVEVVLLTVRDGLSIIRKK